MITKKTSVVPLACTTQTFFIYKRKLFISNYQAHHKP